MTSGRLIPPDPRLRQRRIEHKAKPVVPARGFVDAAEVGNDTGLKADLDEAIDSITRGQGLPERFYRAGIDDDRDTFLATYGVLHIHLGGKDSDVLVYLVQYDETVVLLRTGTHAELQRTPPSSVLRSILAGALTGFDQRASTHRAQTAARQTQQARRVQAETSASQKASLAKFKEGLRLRPPRQVHPSSETPGDGET